ncbi:MAG: hypothetical protein CVU65_17435 [Deltaproteobacteria bacterium HGW-Deltaproteobacteria-22]|nr:MAG: hypothetical protein CVU65_17435 [Deltaproteobacteria bacterium HGW-Deltaproteobacteria-22]
MRTLPIVRLAILFALSSAACTEREEDSRLRKTWGECTRNTECGAGRICRNRKCVDTPPSPSGSALVPPEGMVHVPAGEFLMGSNRGLSLERPQVQSRTQDFFIDLNEVTVEAWQACQQAGHCPEPRCTQNERPSTAPITCVTQDAAAAYCAFTKKRLPTEEEWEKAARGVDARTYPWGEPPPSCERANFAGCTATEGPEPVGTHPTGAGPYGTLDQAGNAWEWTASTRRPWDQESDPRRLQAGHAPPTVSGPPPKARKQTFFIIRGGSYLDPPASLRTSQRLLLAQDFYSRALGFRCVADPR